jgi:inorganic pyrophosphatase
MAGCTNCACSHAGKNESKSNGNGNGNSNGNSNSNSNGNGLSLANGNATCSAMAYSVREIGARNTLEYRSFVEDADGRVVSPFHDIALYPNPSDHGIVNFVIEIPRWTNAKLEISKEELMNPVKQDVKKGALRFVKNVFPYTGYPWNYGALPQTWEDPHEKDRETGYNGDNDPIDAIEVGGPVEPTGTVKAVKILGCLALIDEGETDWKIFVVDVKDPLAGVLNDISDVETHCPGLIDATRSWFRSYKIPDGKPANNFAFDGAVRDRTFAIRVVEETAAAWKRLISGKAEKDAISCVTRVNRDSPYYIQPADEARIPTAPKEKIAPAPVDPLSTTWVYLKQ